MLEKSNVVKLTPNGVGEDLNMCTLYIMFLRGSKRLIICIYMNSMQLLVHDVYKNINMFNIHIHEIYEY